VPLDALTAPPLAALTTVRIAPPPDGPGAWIIRSDAR
jgi:hypothetical protein